MQPTYAVMFLLLATVICQTIVTIAQTVRLQDWKRRAIIAETECKHMAELYGPPKR